MVKMKQARSRRSVQRRAACVNQIRAIGVPPPQKINPSLSALSTDAESPVSSRSKLANG